MEKCGPARAKASGESSARLREIVEGARRRAHARGVPGVRSRVPQRSRTVRKRSGARSVVPVQHRDGAVTTKSQDLNGSDNSANQQTT